MSTAATLSKGKKEEKMKKEGKIDSFHLTDLHSTTQF